MGNRLPTRLPGAPLETLLVRAELVSEERCRVRAPGDLGRVHEAVQRLAHVRQALRLERELVDAGLERELAVHRAELVRDRGDGAAVQVEPARRVAARGEEERRAPGRAVRLVLGHRHVRARDGCEHDERGRELALVVLAGERLLELHEPGRAHGQARIRAPSGSKSGSSATWPGIQRPNTSTSTARPGVAASAGTYAYAIERSTV